MSPSLIENPLHCMKSLLGKHYDTVVMETIKKTRKHKFLLIGQP